MQYIYLFLGFLMLSFAIVGIILPLLPTVPFLLLAAFFFAKSSQRVHTWLLNHKIFGTMIEDWNSRGAINKKSKISIYTFGCSCYRGITHTCTKTSYTFYTNCSFIFSNAIYLDQTRAIVSLLLL